MDRRRILEKRVDMPTALKLGTDCVRLLVQPALNDVTGMPPMVDEHPATSHAWIESPITCPAGGARRRLRPESVPHTSGDRSDLVVMEEATDQFDDRRMVPIMDRVQDLANVCRQC
jgi:hypothetical protein